MKQTPKVLWVVFRSWFLDHRICREIWESITAWTGITGLVVIYFLFDLLKFIDYWMLRLPFKIVVCTFVLFFFQQPFLKPVVYKQVCRARQTLVINQRGQNELSISKIQFNSRGDSLTDWQLAEIMACFLAEALVHKNTNHGDIHTINYRKGATLFVEHSSHTWEEWHFSYFIIYRNHPWCI